MSTFQTSGQYLRQTKTTGGMVKYWSLNVGFHTAGYLTTKNGTVVGRTEVGVEEFGRDIIVADDPKARLMYYVDSIYSVLDLTSIQNIQKLRKYRQYAQLSETETSALLSLCLALSPDKLTNKVIFQDDGMCGHDDNKFFKINTVQHNLLISEAVIIGGQRCSVKKIMAYKVPWIQWCWIGPMEHFKERLERQTSSSGCALL